MAHHSVPKEYTASGDMWMKGQIELTSCHGEWSIFQRIGESLYPLGGQRTYADAMREASVHSRARDNRPIFVRHDPFPAEECHN